MPGALRRAGAVLVVAVPAATVLFLVLSWRDRLPKQLATHWTTGDRPDAFTGRDAFIDGWAVATVAAVSISIAVALSVPRGRQIAFLVAGAVAGFLSSLGLLVTVPNLDLSDPRQAEMDWAAGLPIPLMAGLAGLAWWLHGRPEEPGRPATRRPPAELPRLAPGEPASYVDTATNWGFAVAVAAALAGLGLVVSVLVTPWLGLELVVLAAFLAWFARTTVRAGEDDDLVLKSGPITYRVPIGELTGAKLLDQVSPFSDFGGGGLRFSRRTVALVQRRGPAMEAARTERRKVVVTCRDPQRLAAVLNTLADRRFD